MWHKQYDEHVQKYLHIIGTVWLAEWEPHWICAGMREWCFEEGIEETMFQIGAPDIWDYTAVLLETSIWSSKFDWQWFSFRIYVSGCIFRLKDEQMWYACTRCSSSMATSALDEISSDRLPVSVWDIAWTLTQIKVKMIRILIHGRNWVKRITKCNEREEVSQRLHESRSFQKLFQQNHKRRARNV